MNVSRRHLYAVFAVAGCCLPALLPVVSFGQSPTTQPSAPSTQSPANPGSQPANTQPGAAQTGTSHSGPNNTTPATTPGNTAGPTAGRNAAVETGNAAAAAGHMGSMSGDARLAAWLIVDNEGEIAVSEIGRQKAQDPGVKQFAERMIQEHNQMLEKLRPIASNANAGLGGRRTDSTSPGASGATSNVTIPADNASVGGNNANPRDAAANTTSGTGTASVGATTGAGNTGNVASSGSATVQSSSTGNLSAISLKRELGAQCLQSKQQELNSKQGAEFDKCFMGMQLAMHKEAADTLRVFQKHATGELRQALDEALKTTEAHLEHAKQVHKAVEQQAATSAK